MSYHVTQFYQAFPRVSIASDKRWGEKAWVRGYGCGTFTNSSVACATKYKSVTGIFYVPVYVLSKAINALSHCFTFQKYYY